jgi:hypothetical protein
MDRIEYQFSRRLDLFARRQGHLACGFVSLITWLREKRRLRPRMRSGSTAGVLTTRPTCARE